MVAQQVLSAAVVLPVLALGGTLNAVLVAFGVVGALVLLFVGRALPSVGVGRLQVRVAVARDLVVTGWPFLLFGITMALKPNIDAIFLSKLAPPEVMGWHAAAQKLLGALVFPAAALVGALYPTLCRLHNEDQEGFRSTCREALRTASLVVVPLALGTYLYADEAVRIFSRHAFGPAADNLRFLAPFVLLVYLSMPLGSSLMAAGRQRAWAGVQMLCILASVVLDPLLVPWFQQRTGNGGLGICVATLVSEVLMVGGGIWLLPRGVFTRAFVRSLLPPLAAAGAMAVVAWVLEPVSHFVAAPLSVLAYGAALWALGGLGEEQIATLRAAIARKARRA
jgi:O-antigen/teichoic acid export membrane protein